MVGDASARGPRERGDCSSSSPPRRRPRDCAAKDVRLQDDPSLDQVPHEGKRPRGSTPGDKKARGQE
eukprot:13271729-Alexandrium_andersonii.AAC.1